MQLFWESKNINQAPCYLLSARPKIPNLEPFCISIDQSWALKIPHVPQPAY